MVASGGEQSSEDIGSENRVAGDQYQIRDFRIGSERVATSSPSLNKETARWRSVWPKRGGTSETTNSSFLSCSFSLCPGWEDQ